VAIKQPADLVSLIKLESLRVRSPTSVVFLCGGAIDETLDDPGVLRDAFYRLSNKLDLPYQVVLAEKAKPLTAEAGYHDLLSFESDIAQVVGLILLFAESAGSLAELGAFAALEAIAPSLLAVLCNAHYDAQSFIRNGPVAYLENNHGDESVHVLDCNEIGLDEQGRIVALDMAAFSTSMFSVVDSRLAARPEWSKFDPSRSGHVILFIVGMCHEYGALTQKEIRALAASAGATEVRFDNYIYCAVLLGWLRRIRKGNHVFYVAGTIYPALNYHFKDDVDYRDKVRWRADFRVFWKAKDPSRLKAIADVTAEIAS
jgi:hypothetical protein